jgi:pyridoxamine 5'-phosphate oxidase
MPLDAKPNAAVPLADVAGNKKPDRPEPPNFYNDLTLTLETAWNMLAQGVTDRDASLHTLCVASVDLAGYPQQRSMVLRECNRAGKTLQFHTDVRSAKISHLRAQPRVSVLGYDHGRKTQLRINGNAALSTEGSLVERAWQTTRNVSRIAYSSRVAPGTMLANAADHETLHAHDITADDAIAFAARENFCVVTVAIHELEWVYLNAHGNRRAIFTWPDGTLEARWIQA